MATPIRFFLVSMILGGIFLTLPTRAYACMGCLDITPTPEEMFEKSEIVFAGRVIRSWPLGEQRWQWGWGGPVVFRVEDTLGRELMVHEVEALAIWKGPSVSTFIIRDRGCGSPQFKLGEAYLVYTSEFENELGVGTCGRTGLIGDVTEDLTFLGGARAAPPAGIYPAPLLPSPSNPEDPRWIIISSIGGIAPATSWAKLWASLLGGHLPSFAATSSLLLVLVYLAQRWWRWWQSWA